MHPDHDLLHAYLDGSLPASEVQALEARLREEPALAAELVRQGREEAVMREWARGTAAAEAVTREAAGPVEALASPKPGARRRSWPARATIVLALTACVVVVAILITQLPRTTNNPAGPPVATVEEVHGEVQIVTTDGRVELAENGQSLYAGQEIHTGEDESSTVVRIHDSRLMLASETRMRVGRDDAVNDAVPLFFVSTGIVNAEIMQKPLVLRSSLAELRGKQGKFSFVSLPGSTFMETDDGLARFTRKSDGHTIDVKRGQFAVVNQKDEPLQSRPLPTRVTAPRRTLPVGGGPVHGLFFDPEGLSLVTCTADTIKRWDLGTGKPVVTVYSQKKRAIRSFAPSADGRFFALNSEERHVKLIEAATGAERWSQKGTRRVAASTLAPDGRTVAVSWTGKEGNEVRLYDTALGLERTLVTGQGAVNVLAWSPRGGLLATGGSDRSVRIWDVNDLHLIRAFTKLPNEPRSIAFPPDEELVAIGDRKGYVRVCDPDNGSEKQVLTGHLRDVVALSFSPDGRTLASSSTDGMTRVWHVASGQELASFKGHAGAAVSVAYSNDGRTLATGGVDKKVLFWDLPAVP